MLKFIKILFLLLFISNSNLFSQEKEFLDYFRNPSFEGEPKLSTLPPSWLNCGAKEESVPDTQPGSFSVETEAQDGDTYIGMVVRDNGTREAIAQRLKLPLKKDSTYYFSCYLAQSPEYWSMSPTTYRSTNFDNPCVLRIYLGNRSCQRIEYVGSSEKLRKKGWREYIFKFIPTMDFEYLLLEADYFDVDAKSYNGNLLIDNISIYKIKN